jgi:hypothetical protein
MILFNRNIVYHPDFVMRPLKDSSVGMRADKVLESLTSVILYVMYAAIAVPRLPHCLVLLFMFKYSSFE